MFYLGKRIGDSYLKSISANSIVEASSLGVARRGDDTKPNVLIRFNKTLMNLLYPSMFSLIASITVLNDMIECVTVHLLDGDYGSVAAI